MTQLEKIQELVAKKAHTSVRLAKDIWEFAELPFEETKSAAALIQALQQEGFSIRRHRWYPHCLYRNLQERYR